MVKEYLQIDQQRKKSITHYGQHINHEKEPNTKLKEENGEYNIYSIKPIKKGDELTTDYDDTPSFISKSNPEWNKIKKQSRLNLMC